MAEAVAAGCLRPTGGGDSVRRSLLHHACEGLAPGSRAARSTDPCRPCHRARSALADQGPDHSPSAVGPPSPADRCCNGTPRQRQGPSPAAPPTASTPSTTAPAAPRSQLPPRVRLRRRVPASATGWSQPHRSVRVPRHCVLGKRRRQWNLVGPGVAITLAAGEEDPDGVAASQWLGPSAPLAIDR